MRQRAHRYDGIHLERARSWRVLPLAAAVALGGALLSGCGGSSGRPGVASVASTTALASTTPSPGAATSSGPGNATGFLVEWAGCMRSHGDPGQTDPTIDNHYGINITIPLADPALSNEVHGGTSPCNQYLAAASSALRAAHPAPPPPSADATGVPYAACMRANGVPNYPDPTGNRTDLRGIDMNSPFFIRANKLCGKKIGAPAWWINGWGPPGNISVSNIPPGGPGPNTPNRPRSNGGATTAPGAVTSGSGGSGSGGGAPSTPVAVAGG